MSAFTFRGMTIPPRMMGSLHAYVDHGHRTGGFLYAVLTNDLRRACETADDENMRIIPAYVAWLYTSAPSPCWGDPERVDAWIASFK